MGSPIDAPNRSWFRPLLRGRLAAAILAAGLASALAAPALAESSGPTVTVGSTTPDQATNSVRLSDVSIVYPGASGLKVAIKAIVLKGMSSTDDAFTADEIDVEGLTSASSTGTDRAFAIASATMKTVSGPLPSTDKLSATGKPGDLPPLADWLLAAKAKSITIPTVSLSIKMEGTSSDTVYHDINFEDVSAGKIAAFTMAGGEVSGTGKSPDATVKMTMGAIKIEALDLGTYAAWLDDGVAAAAPKEKRTVYKSFSVDGLSLVSADSTIGIETIKGADVKLGPPSMKPSDLMVLLDKIQADPKYGEKAPAEVVGFLRAALQSFEIGLVEITGMKVGQAGKPPVSIGLMRFENFAGSSIGEIRYGDLAFTDEKDGTAVKIGSFAIRGFEVIDLDKLLDTVAKGGSPDTLAMADYPKLRITGIALADLDATIPGKGKFTIGGITLDAPEWAGFLPTELKTRTEGFSMPVAAIEDESSRDQFKALGLDTLTINSSADLAWTESDETFKLGPVTLDIDGVGAMKVTGEFGGVPRSVFEDPKGAEQAIASLDFRGLSVSLDDGGAFAKILDMLATEQGTTREELAGQASQQVQGMMIMVLGMEDAAKSVSTALETFIKEPKSLSIDVTTLEPIPAIALMQISNGDPTALAVIKKSVLIEASANE